MAQERPPRPAFSGVSPNLPRGGGSAPLLRRVASGERAGPHPTRRGPGAVTPPPVTTGYIQSRNRGLTHQRETVGGRRTWAHPLVAPLWPGEVREVGAGRLLDRLDPGTVEWRVGAAKLHGPRDPQASTVGCAGHTDLRK